MAFTPLNDDLNIIQKLPDLPNDVGGLSADELKAAYDEAGILIKEYINNILIKELESVAGAGNIGIKPIEGVSAETVQRALEILRGQLFEATAGTIPDGSLITAKFADGAVTSEKLADRSVTSEKLVDGAVTDAKINSVSASKVSGSFGTDKISDLAVTAAKIADFAINSSKLSLGAVTEEKIASGAVTGVKIADGAVSQKFTATIPAEGWMGDVAPYTNVVTVTGLLAADTPLADMIPSDTFETAEAEMEAYGNIYRMTTAENTLTVYATEKPTVDINIQLKAVRK